MSKKTKKPNGYWTLTRCIDNARSYSNKKTWEKENRSAYTVAHRKGWLKECCVNMKTKDVKPAGYWTIERCKASAKYHQNKAAWQKAEIGAYKAAHKNGWLPECCAHMKELIKPSGYWTLERVKASARLYPTKKVWEKSEPSAYYAAQKNGWLAECCVNMKTKDVKPAGYWTLERCKASASYHPSPGAWKKVEKSAYTTAARNGWLPECCTHMANKELDVIKYLKTAGRQVGKKERK
jgi:hypothetical protein